MQKSLWAEFNENGQSVSKKAKNFGKMSHSSCVISKPHNSSVISPKHWSHLRVSVVANGKKKSKISCFFIFLGNTLTNILWRRILIAKPHNSILSFLWNIEFFFVFLCTEGDLTPNSPTFSNSKLNLNFYVK